jgi:pantetheine-phosphate adenylyltransferase
MKKSERIAIVPGSFDPITLGHVDIIKRAAKMYDRVVVAVMINRDKRYLFTLAQRKQFAEAALKEIPNVSVISSEGMLWELARDLDACALVKGYRNEQDLAYEKTMADYNREHYPAAETILLPADERLLSVSSTLVREKLANGEDLHSFLPQSVIDEIYKIIPRSL